MELGRDEIAKIALLGRLKLTDEESERMKKELTTILGYFEQIASVDTTDVEPLAHPLPMRNVFREDVARRDLTPDEALANAPKRAGNFYSVPAVLD